MTTTGAKSSLYPSASVFDCDLNNGAKVGRRDHKPNDPFFDIAVIEFHDSGSFVDQTQLSETAYCIVQARKANENGAVVVVFIHGWHHNASWEGDTHFKAFREILKSLTVREKERYGPSSNPRGRRVVGIYFGWNGDPANSWLRRTGWLTHLSFFFFFRTAKRIGDSEDIRKALRSIVAATKDPIDASPESPLIFIGHSMGALMLESAFLSLLVAKDKPFVRLRTLTPGSCVDIRRNNDLISFPDVLIALNSAADSRIANNIKAELEKQNLTKKLVDGDIQYSPPLFISLTSPADFVTKIIWRLAQFPRLWRKTDGHDSSLFTHTLKKEATKVFCKPKGPVDFGQNWHCLRAPKPKRVPTPTPSIAIDLPTRAREGLNDWPDHDRYRLKPLLCEKGSYPAWVFQVPPEIVSNHNDIFNSLSSTLILALIQISGQS